MNKMKKLVLAACTGFALIGMSGCASTKIAELATPDVAAPAAEPQVSRPLHSYGAMGGYRYRRFAAVATAG